MLRPERMSRVSVTGATSVMDDVIETVHDLRLLHVSEYDGAWEGFDHGNPVEGADEAARKLVTVRALESTLDISDDDAGPRRSLDDAEIEERLEEIRVEVNELDDRREELRSDLRSVEDQIDTDEPFVELGIDLELLSGYDSLTVAVGEGDAGEIEEALSGNEDVDAFEVFAEDDAVAVFVAPTREDVTAEDVLVGVPFQAYQIPDAEGDPTDHREELRHRKQKLESQLERVEADLGELKLDVAGFLLAAEEQLTIEVQKREAPLSFATTENAFVAEGWLPTSRYDEFVNALETAVGDHVEIEELEVAEFDRGAHDHHEEPIEGGGEPAGTAMATEGVTDDEAGPVATEGEPGDDEAVADGGVVTMDQDDPPVVQNNPSGVRPFELLTQAVGRPKYSELDPTFLLFLTFPLMFGFMIGDVGYGLVYTGIGVLVLRRFDAGVMRNFGWITVAAGVMTTVFGVLYGEIFGLHTVSQVLWDPLIGHAPIKKGLMPANTKWAQAWFIVTALFGVLHMSTGYVFEFVENYSLHGTKEAILETGSWLLALTGLWVFVFSRLFEGSKPDLLFRVLDSGEGAAVALGFAGFPPVVGWVGLALVAIGGVLIVVGPTHEIVEFHVILAHALSYLRIAAVLLAKAGMAFAVNLLFFGAYLGDEGEFHFMLDHGPHYVAEHYGQSAIIFDGMIHGGLAMLIAGIFVLVIGHIVVLALGVTSAGIQSIRLEYFEFFSKFYEGGGTVYAPFGHDREHTAEE